jgi:hypothetical protein
VNPRTLAILVFDDVEVLDFCGPFEVFSVAGRFTDPSAVHLLTVAEKLKPVVTRGGLTRQVWPMAARIFGWEADRLDQLARKRISSSAPIGCATGTPTAAGPPPTVKAGASGSSPRTARAVTR